MFQSYRQKIDFTSKILRRWRKLAKSIFSMRIWIVKEFSIFFNWSCNLKRFLSTKSIWIEIEQAKRTYIQFISFFNDLCKNDSFFFFFECWNESHRDRIALSLFKVRDKLLSKMSFYRSIVLWFIRVFARSKWVYTFEIFQNRCSACLLLICIFCE